jgi:DNA-binding transcriptional LysR family regulator
VLADLETRAIDIAVAPLAAVPARFVSALLHEETFVIAMRAGHPFADAPSLDRYCGMQHLVVSMTGDPHGFVDVALTAHGRARRVALTVPNFMMALALIAETDLITALPRRFAVIYGPRYGVITREAPIALPRFEIRAIASKAAMMDAGVAWLYGMVQDAAAEADEAAGPHPGA